MNSVRAVLLLAAVALLPATAQAQGAIEAWVQRYNGTGNGGDYASAMAVDTNGNVYVTGSWTSIYDPHSYGWATLKYSSSGVPLWTNLYNGVQAYALAVDSSGNVFVTGSNDGVAGQYCTTIKYSSSGVPLWTNLYTASASYARTLAVDSSGNVVVVGGAADNYLTLKYSSAGALLWARQYNGPGNGKDVVSAVALDASGNVYVTGSSEVSTGPNYATVAYSSAGVLLWAQRYNGPVNGYDYSWALAVDGTGNVYVTGKSQGIGGYDDADYLTIKYSSAGLPLWTNRYSGSGNGYDEAKAVAVDASGNAFVTGEGAGDRGDYVTLKYSSAGVPLWTNRYNGPANGNDLPKAMALDARGNVYVTGSSGNTTAYPWDFDYATVAYSSAGVALWTNRNNGPPNGDDGARAIALDGSGNVFVTGNSRVDNNDDVVTIKYVIPPIITRQPLSCTNAVGTTASFTVEAAGGTPLSYQWRRQGTNLVDGGNVSGVTSTNLLVANVQLADAAGYSVVVTNAYGSVTSSVAQLTVTIPPSPGRFTNLSYSPVMGFSFIFRDGTMGQPYRIQRSTSMAEGIWTDWQSFTYTEPIFLTDMGATGVERRFYRAVSP